MKFSTIAAVLTAALCMTGCKYAGINEGASDSALNDNANGSDISALSSSDAQSGSLDGVTGRAFDDLYQRCTDVNFAPIYFGFDSTVVPAEELPKIDDVVSHLNANPNRVTIIEGNCDERGSSEYNMSLGENRAVIIRNYLVQSGISADRIQTRSYGAEKPADPGHDESAWARNRRGEFAIFQK